MRAVLVERHGPPDVLTITGIPVPQPAPGQVRIRVRAGGVQPFDTYLRQGHPDFRMTPPHQLGNEFAGVIDQPGDNTTQWSVGDAVLGWAPIRSLADYVLADVDAIVAKPRDLPFDVAGGLGASGQTALTALADLDIRSGDTLLIHAAAGGAGSMAVQLARHCGARVIGTASSANHDYLRSLGASPVAYGPGLIDRVHRLAPHGVDAALDAIGGQALTDSLHLVADETRIGTLVDHARATDLGVRAIRARRANEQLQQLVELHRQGTLGVTIRAKYPLDQVGAAHRDVEYGHGTGKVIITISDARP